MNTKQRSALAWAVVALFAGVTLIRGLVPTLLPAPLVSVLMQLLPLVFFVVHSTLTYRLRDVLVFAAITLVVSNVFENMSVLTGFPFGRYVYTDWLGPKLFLVPVLIGPAYTATGYLAWTIARVIAGAANTPAAGHRSVTVPLLASCMMVSWDLAFDPIFSTIFQSWLWLDGGSYFGVPVQNFLGWLLTTYVFFQLFALYLQGQPRLRSPDEQPSRMQSVQAILFYGLIGAGYVLNSLRRDVGATVTDPTGVVWRVQDIYAVTGLVASFTMGAWTMLALVKPMELSPAVQPASLHAAPQTSVGRDAGLTHKG